MDIKIIGCSGAKSIDKGPTAFLIDDRILIDSGSVVSRLESKFILENIKYLLLTHSHFDHIMELPFLLELFVQRGENPFTIFASDDSVRSLHSNVFNYQCWPNLFEIAEEVDKDISLQEYREYQTISIEDYEITPVPVNHTIPTHGFIIENGGKSFGFTGDTYTTDSFWENCNAKDNLKAVIMDVSFPGGEAGSAEITRHLSTVLLPAELDKLKDKSVEIYISHMKPEFAEEIKSEISELNTGFGLTILEDGMTVTV